jgi:hypothetical protein
MVNLITGSTKYLDLPVVDGDFMGRAYPTGWQTTPNVYDKGNRGEMLLPSAMCSGDGSTIVSLLRPVTSPFPFLRTRSTLYALPSHIRENSDAS